MTDNTTATSLGSVKRPGAQRQSPRRRGTAIIYATAGILVFGAFAALSVDWGKVQLTKTELQAAADGAARYAAAGLQNDLAGSSAAYANAAAVIAQNKANGRSISFNAAQDVEIGKWNPNSRKFTVDNDLDDANAVRVTTRCVASRGTAVPLAFLSMLGRQTTDVQAVSVAMVDYSGAASGAAGNGRYQYFVPATNNPWLSGVAAGTVASVNNPHSNPDYAGTGYTDDGKTKNANAGRGFATGGSTNAGSANDNYAAWGDYAAKKASPIKAGGILISAGNTITLDGVNGGATNAAGQATDTADGNTSSIVDNSADSENGIANVNAPLNSVIGVFLNDSAPNTLFNKTFPPATLDFTTAAQRDFLTLKPGLRQPFFIGDGRTSSGEVQQFVPPTGATRLFICTMDAYEWSNNVGGFYVTAHVKGHIVTVK